MSPGAEVGDVPTHVNLRYLMTIFVTNFGNN